MPTEEELNERQEGGETTLPQIDPKDEEIKSLKLNYHQLAAQMERTNGLLEGLLAGQTRQAPQQQATEPLITDEEIEEALREGSGAAGKFRKLVDNAVGRVVKDHIDPLRNTGLNAIAGTVMELTQAKMPYYNKYKDEVDRYINSLTPEMRLNSQAILACYNTVVGSHFSEILNEENQKNVRQAAAGVIAPKGRVTKKDAEEVRDAEEIAPNALDDIGRDQESFARKLGYGSWKEYQKLSADERIQ